MSSYTATKDDAETTPLRLPAAVDPPSDVKPATEKVWVVFGATGHLGRGLVKTALDHGDKVVAIGKLRETRLESMQDWHDRCLGALCDVRFKDSVDAAIRTSIAHWGRIDIIVNCTGYGVIAAAEDQSAFDLDNQFATNFMGTLHILQAGIPYFRINGIPGRFLIFSSTAGALGIPGMAPYCATKYAVEGLIESMLYEVHAFGIKATLVEPGHVRNEDSEQPRESEAPESPSTQGSFHAVAAPSRYGHFAVKPHASPAYDNPNSPAGHAKRVFRWLDSRQPTSATRSAELVWQLGHCSYPPLRLILGSYAVESIRDRLKSIIEEIEDWKHLSFSPDTAMVDPFPAGRRARTHSGSRSGSDANHHSEDEDGGASSPDAGNTDAGDADEPDEQEYTDED